MVLRQFIPTPQAEASASYDFEDVEEAIGFVSFNAATTSGSRILTRRAVFSNDVETIASTLSGSHSKELHLIFDTAEFNLPRTVKGTAFIGIPLSVQTQGNGARKEAYTIAEIFHWDGTTATSLGRSTSGSQLISSTVAAYSNAQTQLHKIALTQKTFKSGDILRVVAEGYSIQSSNAAMTIGHDPQGREGNTNYLSGSNTKFIADIPFKLDL